MAIEHTKMDAAKVIEVIKELSAKRINPHPTIHSSLSHTPCLSLPQLERLEKVSQLQSRVWVRGSALSLEEMLNLIKEDVIGETGVEFLGSDKDIIERVLHQNDEDSSDEDNDDEDNLPVEIMKPSEALEICTQIKRVCFEYAIPSAPFTINLQTHVRKL